ncbi:MAG: hypothetical protein AAF266_09915 [Planctomycetota bacterium]
MVRLCGLAGLLASVPAWTLADTWVDTHDEPTAVWEIDTSSGATVIARERVRLGGARAGEDIGAERIAYAAAPGVPTWAWRTVPASAVIEELKITLDVRATLPGTLLAAEVVLPRSKASDGQPIRLRVRSSPAAGSRGGDVRLELATLPQRVQREARVWRLANPNTPIDTRGAYITRLAVGLPGSGRPAEAWVKEAQIVSLVTPLRRVDETAVAVGSDATKRDETPTVGVKRPTVVSLRSDGFQIDNELFFPRVWRWRGEPLPTLAERGINTVWLEQAPTPQQLAEAAHHRLRVLCPPPTSATAVPTWDRVLAWVLPGPRSRRDIDASLVTIEKARGLEKAAQRPILVHATEAAGEWSRLVDGLLIDVRDADTGSEAVPPGTPVLATARLDASPLVVGQLDALLGDGVAATWLPPADVLGSVNSAVQSEAIGVAFLAEQRIDEADEATTAAAGWLEAVNRRLRLIEPWLLGPRSVSPINDPPSATLLDRGGVRLAAIGSLTPLPRGTTSDKPPTLTLPGVHGSSQAYRLSVAGLAAWPIERRAGSVVAQLPRGNAPGDLLICNDPRVARSLRDYTRQTAPRAAANLIQLTGTQLRLTEALTPADRQAVLGRLGTARLAMSRRDYGSAYDTAHAALAILSDAEVERRRIARQGPWESSSPLTVLPTTLTDHFRMTQLLSASPRGANRLYGGSFEDIDELRRHGWRHPASDSGGSVELVEANAQHGERVLRLTNHARVVSPNLDLFEGETFEVTGFARIESNNDRGQLVVTDTLGGAELALRLGDTAGEWRPFHLLRAAGANSAMSVTFATQGTVAAEIDGVMVRAIEPLGVAARPERQPK